MEIGDRDYYNKRFADYTRGKGNMFNDGYYRTRAEFLLKWIKELNPKTILSIASGGTILAQLVLKEMPDVRFRWSDFAKPALELAKKQIPQAEIIDIDAREPFDDDYDLLICVSLEHLKDDIGFIKNIKSGKDIIFSIPNVNAPSHFRVLSTEQQIRERYSEYITIDEIEKLSVFHLLRGKKK